MEFDTTGFPLVKSQIDEIEEMYGESGKQYKVGKLRVHKSGKITIGLPNGEYEVERGISSNFKQKIFVFDDQDNTVRDIGDIGSHLVTVKTDI